jgi:hypothetical protein
MEHPDFTGRPVRELIDYMVKGNREAGDFIEKVFFIAHQWDDLIDGDKPVDIGLLMYGSMVVLPGDPFYQRHFPVLSPVIETAITSWLTANTLEATDEPADQAVSFVLRSDHLNVTLMAVRLSCGWEWAKEMALLGRRHCHAEGFAGYLANLKEQRKAAAQAKLADAAAAVELVKE